MTNTLSLTRCPVEREAGWSFVSRVASVNGLTAGDFCGDMGLTFRAVIDGDEKALSGMCEVAGVEDPGSLDWTPVKMSKGGHKLRGHRFHGKTIRTPQLRGCPACLREDARDSEGAPETAMAMRGHWMLPHVTLCLIHEMALVPLWKVQQPYDRYDSAPHLKDLAPEILAGTMDGETRTATDFERWFDARLVGQAPGTWLDTHPLHAAATFCRLLGHALSRHETTAPASIGPDLYWALYDTGFKVARHGEDAIRAALTGLQDLPGGPHDGPKKVFPKLYDRLAHDYDEDPDYAPYRDILRDHMRATWPLGPGDELLGEPVMRRRLHSVRTAAQATGVDQRRLRKILAAEGIVPAEGKPDAWTVFDAEGASEILESVKELLAAKDFAASLSMSRSQFDLLVTHGILVPAVAGDGVKAVWDPAAGHALLERLFSGAVQLRVPVHAWAHVSKSAQRLKINPGAVLQAILDGRVTRVGNHADFEGYKALYVDHEEVAAALSGVAPQALTIETFAKSVGINQPIRLRRLIVQGHTPATQMRNPKTRAIQFYITTEDAAAFHERFLTTRTMATAFGRSWQSLSADLRRKGVMPFSPDGVDYGPIYLRAEVRSSLT